MCRNQSDSSNQPIRGSTSGSAWLFAKRAKTSTDLENEQETHADKSESQNTGKPMNTRIARPPNDEESDRESH